VLADPRPPPSRSSPSPWSALCSGGTAGGCPAWGAGAFAWRFLALNCASNGC